MKRCYTFAVYITADEATDDGDGYTPKDVEALLKSTLNYYAAPLNKERRSVEVDCELIENEAIAS